MNMIKIPLQKCIKSLICCLKITLLEQSMLKILSVHEVVKKVSRIIHVENYTPFDLHSILDDLIS